MLQIALPNYSDITKSDSFVKYRTKNRSPMFFKIELHYT